MKDYLFCFTYHNHYADFRLAEFDSACELLGYDFKDLCPLKRLKCRFLKLSLDCDEHARFIASRCVLLKFVVELWAEGQTTDEMHADLKRKLNEFSNYYSADKSFRYEHYTFGRKFNKAHKLSRFEELSYIPFEGRIVMENADFIYAIVEDYEHYDDCGNLESGTSSSEPSSLKHIYFGRLISHGQTSLPHYYGLEKRVYIGNTSMDPAFALIMANLGKIRNNSLCIDPFAGTGSILVGAAHFGARCIGSEIHYLVVHAKGKPSRAKVEKRSPNESVSANFEQYGLQKQYLDIILADSSKTDMWRNVPIFDAILCDPPYGIREKCAKLGNRTTNKKETGCDSSACVTFPQKQEYSSIQVFLDLLDFAAQYLVDGGRIVYWFPVKTDGFTEDMIPQHPHLKLIHNCEQKLSSNHSRRLITMQKYCTMKTEELQKQSTAFVIKNPYDTFSVRDIVLGRNHMKE